MLRPSDKFKEYASGLLNAYKEAKINELVNKFKDDLARKNITTMECLIDLYIEHLRAPATEAFKNKVYIPLYGSIEVTPPADKILCLPIFNRLRWIRQLSFAYFDYPSANHTRFEHSLGVYYLAKNLLEVEEVKKILNEELEEAFLVAALLHDTAHGPGSHSIEKIYGAKYDERNLWLLLRSKDLEDFGLGKVLDSNLIREVSKIIPGGEPSKGEYYFLREALDSEVDIDRLDFLNRDSYFCGLQTGRIDSLAIIKGVKPGKDENGNYRYSFSDDSKMIEYINAAIFARRNLYPLVYQGENQIAMDENYCHALYALAYKNSTKDSFKRIINKFLYLNDHQILSLMMMFGDEYVREFVYNALNCINPYVICYHLNIEDDAGSTLWHLLYNEKKAPIEGIIRLEHAFCHLLNIGHQASYEPRFFIRFPWRNPEKEKQSSVLIRKEDGMVNNIEKINPTSENLLKVIFPSYNNIFFIVDKNFKEKAQKILRKIFEKPDLLNIFVGEADEIILPETTSLELEVEFSEDFVKKVAQDC